jgi:hypothetical protein
MLTLIWPIFQERKTEGRMREAGNYQTRMKKKAGKTKTRLLLRFWWRVSTRKVSITRRQDHETFIFLTSMSLYRQAFFTLHPAFIKKDCDVKRARCKTMQHCVDNFEQENKKR